MIQPHREGEPERDAEILEVLGADGAPPYRVQWQDDGRESIYFPDSGVRAAPVAAPSAVSARRLGRRLAG